MPPPGHALSSPTLAGIALEQVTEPEPSVWGGNAGPETARPWTVPCDVKGCPVTQPHRMERERPGLKPGPQHNGTFSAAPAGPLADDGLGGGEGGDLPRAT